MCVLYRIPKQRLLPQPTAAGCDFEPRTTNCQDHHICRCVCCIKSRKKKDYCPQPFPKDKKSFTCENSIKVFIYVVIFVVRCP